MMQANLKPNDDILYERARELKALGIQPYAQHFDRSHSLFEIHESYEGIGYDIPGEAGDFRLCGRIVSLNLYQAGMLVVITDQDATFQLNVSRNELPVEAFDLFVHYVYEGDYIGFAVDYLYREQGYLTGVVKTWSFLALANIPIPKHLSLERQRVQQHLNLASNFSAREIVVTRARMLRYIRQQLAEVGIYEVNTAQSEPLSVINALLQYIVGGIEQVYEIADLSKPQTADWLNHSHELWLHCCIALKSQQQMMHLLEQLLNRLTLHLHSTSRLVWHPLEQMNPAEASETVELINEKHTLEIDMSVQWACPKLYQILNDVLDVDFTGISTLEQALQSLRQAGLPANMIASDSSISALARQVFYDYVAPTLIQPTFVVFPEDDTTPCEGFELYINGILLASGRNEVTDPAVCAANSRIGAGFREYLMIGMPPVSTLSLNLDRLAMLMLGAIDIRDIVYFLAR